jgi:undecaprenyl-diphosphatase
MVHMSGASWDWRIMSAIADHRSPALNHVATRITEAGTSTTVLVIGAVGCVLVMVWRRWYRAGLAAAGAFLVATLASNALKPAFDRQRPPWRLALIFVPGPSFPSTHATTTAAVAVAVLLSMAWSSRRYAAWAATLMLTVVLLVGACMVYIGAHWVTDVIAGWVLGAAIGGIIGLLARPRRPRPAETSRHPTLRHA